MRKHSSNVDKVWEYVIPIDTWILDNIYIGTNSWGQKIQISSEIRALHENEDKPDILDYSIACKDKYNSVTKNNQHLLFKIYYYANRFVFSFSITHNDNNGKIELDYKDPECFKKLEQIIRNAFELYHLNDKIKEMANDLDNIKTFITGDPVELLIEKHNLEEELENIHKLIIKSRDNIRNKKEKEDFGFFD